MSLIAADSDQGQTSYALTLPCGCRVKVSRGNGGGGTRLIEHRASGCNSAAHQPGARVYLWELLPPRKVDRDLEIYFPT